MDARWLFLLLGPFLVVVTGRDLRAAWRYQCFRKGPGQLWDVSRAQKPITFWFLIGGNVAIIATAAWLTVISAVALWNRSDLL
jgi:hypothetical protein